MCSRSRQPRVNQRFDAKAVAGNEIIHLAIEMTPAGNARPQRIKPVLLARNARLRSAPVLDEQQSAAWL
jgi:hypothetical protein